MGGAFIPNGVSIYGLLGCNGWGIYDLMGWAFVT